MPLRVIREDGAVWTFDWSGPERYDPRARITDHPIEGGGNVSDHIFRLPERITTPVAVSETPLRTFGQPLGRRRVDAAIAFLRVAQRGPCTIQTELNTFESMALVGWSHEKKNTNGVPFNLEWRALDIVGSASVEIPADAPQPAVAADVASELDAGEQPTEEVDTADEESDQEAENQSTLAAILAATE